MPSKIFNEKEKCLQYNGNHNWSMTLYIQYDHKI